KHRSLDNAQFLQQMASMGASTSTPYNIPPNSFATTSAYSTSYGNTSSYGYPTTSTSQAYMNPYLTNPPPPQATTSTGMDPLGLDMPSAYGYGAYPSQYANSKLNDYQLHDYSANNTSAAVGSYPGSSTRTPHYAMASSSFGQPRGTTSSDPENEMLKREVAEMTEKLNYVMNSIRNFWSPELKKERQQRRDESMRMAALQDKISQQSAEIQVIRNELGKREKDIGHLLSESDLGEMEEELRRLRKQLTEPPTRDYTNKTLSIHEMQTLKMKMERSELALAEKTQALQNCEIRLKCAEEQNAELQKRLEFLSRSNVVNENQVKMVNEDVNVLRGKLETKNQLIESKDRSMRKQEGEMETLRVQLQESSHKLQESEHKVAQLNHRLDQMESLRRDRDGELERLKRRLMQQPGTRVETELQQRIENIEQDKRKLQETIDSLVKNAELDKHQQLKTFEEENRHLRATIESLQKELSDRQILLASQNEKISQLDLQAKNALRENGHDSRT
ncbi:CBR-ELKS-1 protein, partial [Aphelenchoides avenae]